LPFAISAPAAALLEQLATGADPSALAAAHNLSLAALALWVREPHVKATLDALNDLLALHRAAWRHQVVKDTVESLREVMQHADTLPERRRAATQIIRALSSFSPREKVAVRHGRTRPDEGVSFSLREKVAESSRPDEGVSRPNGARRASEGPPPDIRNPRFEIASAFPSHPASNTSPPSPLSPLSTLDNLADRIFAALQSDDPIVINAVRDLRGGAADESEPAARALDEGIQRLIKALPGATVESTPATVEPDAHPPPRPAGEVAESSRPEGVTRVTSPEAQARVTEPGAQASVRATKLYTLTYPDADPAHFLLRLGHNPDRDDSWLEEIVPIDTT